MNMKNKMIKLLSGLNKSILRYPVTVCSLLLVSFFVSSVINNNNTNYDKIILALIVSVFLALVVQSIYEKFYPDNKIRFTLYGASTVLSVIYYFVIRKKEDFDVEISTKTIVILFVALLLFILIPTIKSKINFNQSFLAFYKASFTAYFYGLVFFIGTAIIIAAIDNLIVSVNYNAYAHMANIIFIIFCPIYLLSLIPLYTASEDERMDSDKEKLNNAIECPKFLGILISYILIPLISVFTIILLIYLVGNIGDKFWADVALEPMLISYSIAVLIIYILASNLENTFTKLFQLIFPKVLIPIVLLQTIASIIKISENGMTYGRYYVILFGVFATIAGVLFSLMNNKRNGIVIAILIVMAVISITPPVDAFTISKASQIKKFETALKKNNMLTDNKLIANSTISKEDKEIIRKTSQYMYNMNYNEKFDYLPNTDRYYNDFELLFGFSKYEGVDNHDNIHYINKYLKNNTSINIKGYDYLAKLEIYNNENENQEDINIEIEGVKYFFDLSHIKLDNSVDVRDENKLLLISFKLDDLYSEEDVENLDKGELDIEEASMVFENEKINIKVIIQQMHITISEQERSGNYTLDILIKIKE